MFNFFAEQNNKQNSQYIIEGNDYNHIKNVLRMEIGDKCLISCDGKSDLCRIDAFEDNAVLFEIIEEDYMDTELPVKIYLFQGLPKADKMELIIQKAVELGVYQVIPVSTKRCVVKLDDKKAKSKIARWQGIAEAAAKQSKRGIIPQVREVMTFKNAVKMAADMEVRLIPYELAEGMAKTKEIISNIQPGHRIAIFIGPEGGFEESEITEALENGIEPITLGKRILRTETAGFTILSWLMYHLETE